MSFDRVDSGGPAASARRGRACTNVSSCASAVDGRSVIATVTPRTSRSLARIVQSQATDAFLCAAAGILLPEVCTSWNNKTHERQSHSLQLKSRSLESNIPDPVIEICEKLMTKR